MASPRKRSTKRRSPKKSARKNVRKSARKSARKSTRKSTRKVSNKCPCCNRVRCTCPKSCKACKTCKACKQWRKSMKGGSSCGTHRQKGGSSCGTHKGAGCGKQHGGVKNSGMDTQTGPSRPKRASATKASVAISQTRKDREKRSQKIKLTKEFKKVLDVEIDRLADMMGKSTASAADDLMDGIGMYMNTMTMGPRQQQSSSKQLPPSRINFFTRQPSKTEYTAQDVLARFK